MNTFYTFYYISPLINLQTFIYFDLLFYNGIDIDLLYFWIYKMYNKFWILFRSAYFDPQCLSCIFFC